jgi:NADH-quinone oxidoreductase subunit L
MSPETMAWVILLAPLVAALVITVATRRRPELSAMVSIGAAGLSFLMALLLLRSFPRHGAETGVVVVSGVPWLRMGGLTVELGLRIDQLSVVMLAVVTGVGLMIHIYSRGYMRGDPGYSRFFACLSLFMFSMLGIVLASNLVLMFVFWELVGVSSYLLIGFWFERPAAADAARKAFITNRLGDFGFILGIIMVWGAVGSVDFLDIQRTLAQQPESLGVMASLAGFLVFMGAMGKSAQFPLHVWLPDAMEGPTPVSALIHAATMVAAGVYMLARAYFLFALPAAWPESLAWLRGVSALDLIAWVGGITALLAALMAIQQSDIKRILAYSTLSQLGYMVMAVGCFHPEAGMYHLVAHAFFKALLFLAAGSIIVALHHEQNIWRMGGLRNPLPVTHWTFLVGMLALCGVPPLSGFYSKDTVLAAAESRPLLFILGLLVAALTALYMFRLYFVALRGGARDTHAQSAHESPPVMLWPLRILAVAAFLAGFWGIHHAFAGFFGRAHESAGLLAAMFEPFGHAPLAAFMGLFATGAGFAMAYALYAGAPGHDPMPERIGVLARWMREKFYFDELYSGLIRITHERVASLAAWIDRWFIEGFLVRGSSGAIDILGRVLRLVQSGNLQTYAFLTVAGLAVVLWLTLL